MAETLFGLVVAASLFCTYYAGKKAERRQVHRWLRFQHDNNVNMLQLAALISVGQHYELDVDDED